MNKTNLNLKYRDERVAGRIPPHSVEAEQSVIGAILVDNEVAHGVFEILMPEDFYMGQHKLIFDAMLSLYESGNPIDAVTLSEALKTPMVVLNTSCRYWTSSPPLLTRYITARLSKLLR